MKNDGIAVRQRRASGATALAAGQNDRWQASSRRIEPASLRDARAARAPRARLTSIMCIPFPPL
ncbi:hypothetical protein BvRS1_02960 [Burkholderia vietnamiensis]|nr:hypothetical protein BvRS1_02960 [Burkholderia vietnamiensis]